jgi:hypothetical protein
MLAYLKSDGCSWWFDGCWRECCEIHDYEYCKGGTKEERKLSDKRLRDCVASKGHKVVAYIMYIGVRVFGMSFLPTSFRWGFGSGRDCKSIKNQD